MMIFCNDKIISKEDQSEKTYFIITYVLVFNALELRGRKNFLIGVNSASIVIRFRATGDSRSSG